MGIVWSGSDENDQRIKEREELLKKQEEKENVQRLEDEIQEYKKKIREMEDQMSALKYEREHTETPNITQSDDSLSVAISTSSKSTKQSAFGFGGSVMDWITVPKHDLPNINRRSFSVKNKENNLAPFKVRTRSKSPGTDDEEHSIISTSMSGSSTDGLETNMKSTESFMMDIESGYDAHTDVQHIHSWIYPPQGMFDCAFA